MERARLRNVKAQADFSKDSRCRVAPESMKSLCSALFKGESDVTVPCKASSSTE